MVKAFLLDLGFGVILITTFTTTLYPAETGCFGTFGALALGWGLEFGVWRRAHLSFGRGGVYSTMRCLLMDTLLHSLKVMLSSRGHVLTRCVGFMVAKGLMVLTGIRLMELENM